MNCADQLNSLHQIANSAEFLRSSVANAVAVGDRIRCCGSKKGSFSLFTSPNVGATERRLEELCKNPSAFVRRGTLQLLAMLLTDQQVKDEAKELLVNSPTLLSEVHQLASGKCDVVARRYAVKVLSLTFSSPIDAFYGIRSPRDDLMAMHRRISLLCHGSLEFLLFTGMCAPYSLAKMASMFQNNPKKWSLIAHRVVFSSLVCGVLGVLGGSCTNVLREMAGEELAGATTASSWVRRKVAVAGVVVAASTVPLPKLRVTIDFAFNHPLIVKLLPSLLAIPSAGPRAAIPHIIAPFAVASSVSWLLQCSLFDCIVGTTNKYC